MSGVGVDALARESSVDATGHVVLHYSREYVFGKKKEKTTMDVLRAITRHDKPVNKYK